ncbi:MAG: transcription elongation factor Spt5 [Nitrososphaeraceae archaeon]|nr:transcription elongation factor Spt5 [Nitrososphaeraceae archaeon]
MIISKDNSDDFSDLEGDFHDEIEEIHIEENETDSSPLQLDTKLQSKESLDSNQQNIDNKTIQNENAKLSPQESDSKFFAVRINGGQENIIANIIQNKIKAKQINVRSILLLDSFKGYLIVEAPDSNLAYEALAGIRHIRGQIRGDLPFKDIERYLVKKPVVSDLNIDDNVEIIAGPFKSMKAKITRVDYEKQEATVVLLDSPYQIPVTVDANYLKKVA